MINASEMAQAFGKRVDHFSKSDHAKAFICVLEQTPYGGRSAPLLPHEIVDNRGHMGIYYCRPLAMKFAAWLSSEFELWVYTTLDDIVFGHYQKHWEAHGREQAAKIRMEELKREMLTTPTKETAIAYFEAENDRKKANRDKTKAIKSQLRLFGDI